MRFRIRTSQGQELSFASEEMFEDFVRSGAVSPDDLIYDASTGEWAPARTHTLILQLQADVSVEDGALGSDGSESGDGGGSTPDGGEVQSDPSLGLSLAAEATPDEAAAAFIAEMEAERATDFDHVETLEGLRIDQTGSGVVEGIVPAEPPKKKTPIAPRPPPALARSGSTSSRARHKPPPPKGGSPKRKKSLSVGTIVMGVVGIAVGVVAVLIGPSLLSTFRDQAEVDPPPVVDPEPDPEPSIPNTEEALRARAAERLLSTLRARLSALRPIPDIWLDGAYLSEPTAYPEVREVWQEYLEIIRALRSEESDLYATAYLGALDDARVMTPATRTLRLAGAVSVFQADLVHREGHYARVDELVSAALVLHDLLSEVEGSITYEPAQGPGLSADPVIEAVGRDEETQELLNNALDRVLDALSADGTGPVDADLVPSWVLEGFREVIAP